MRRLTDEDRLSQQTTGWFVSECGRPPRDMSQDVSLDWLCLPIAKKEETDEWCDFMFYAALCVPDPEHPGRGKVARQERGVVRIIKSTGEITVVEQMPGDDGERRAGRAARIISRHWKKGEYPQQTIYAAG